MGNSPSRASSCPCSRSLSYPASVLASVPGPDPGFDQYQCSDEDSEPPHASQGARASVAAGGSARRAALTMTAASRWDQDQGAPLSSLPESSESSSQWSRARRTRAARRTQSAAIRRVVVRRGSRSRSGSVSASGPGPGPRAAASPRPAACVSPRCGARGRCTRRLEDLGLCLKRGK